MVNFRLDRSLTLIRSQVLYLHRPLHRALHVRRVLGVRAQGRIPSVRLASSFGDFRFVANFYVNQHVAIVAHPRHCQLLPDVGSYLPRTAASSHCPETKRSPRAVPRVNASSAINIDERVAAVPLVDWRCWRDSSRPLSKNDAFCIHTSPCAVGPRECTTTIL